jgi:hypothetical protein
MATPLAVVLNGKRFSVTPNTGDMVAWETHARAGRIPMDMHAKDFPRITHVSFLAYSAGKRARLWEGTFSDFLAGLDEVGPEEADDDAEGKG